MPPEPKKPIEELLEASARARRAEFGADPQMPNPVRARLHDEIARRNRGEESELPRRSWLASFWPRLSLATAVAATLVVASVVWFRSETKISRADVQLAMRSVAAPATMPEDAAAPLRSLDAVTDDRLAKNGDTKFREIAPAEEMLAPAGNLANESRIHSRYETAKPAAAAPTIVARSFAQTAEAKTANVRQRFSQNLSAKAVVPNEKLKQRVNLLNRFDVQQEGDRIRVVDEDGSIYTGKLEQIAQNDARSLANKKEQNFAGRPAAPATRREEAESNEYYFRAAGFNSTLKKNVVLEANYISTPSENQERAKKDAAQAEQNQARIVGTAKVAGEPPVEVDAVAVER